MQFYHFVIMMGGLHNEMAVLRSLGSIIENIVGGQQLWLHLKPQILSYQLRVSPGTPVAQQVTACSLYKLMQSAHSSYLTDVKEFDDFIVHKSFED